MCVGGGGGGSPDPPPPMKYRKNIGFLSNTGPDPLKIIKHSSQHSMLGHHWHGVLQQADDGPLILVFGSFLC